MYSVCSIFAEKNHKMKSVSDNFPRKDVCSDHVRYSMFTAALNQEQNTFCGKNVILGFVLF